LGISLKKALKRLFKSENGKILKDAGWNKKNENNEAGVNANKMIIEIIMNNSVFTQPVQAGDKKKVPETRNLSVNIPGFWPV